MDEQIVYTCTVYDICKQQDCLTPLCDNDMINNYLISPARNATGFEVVFTDEESHANYYAQPNEVFYITDDYYYTKVVDNTFETLISVKKFTESLSEPGYYNLEIEYRFNYALEFFDSEYKPKPVYIQETPLNKIQAYSTYTKKVSLFGGKIKNRVTTLTSSGGLSCSTFPEYNIQGTGNVLDAKLTPISDIVCNPFVDIEQNKLDDDGGFVASVTIGLFTIISLYRPNRVNILTGTQVDIPTCEDLNNPCFDFTNIPFPYDLFNPSDGTHCK